MSLKIQLGSSRFSFRDLSAVRGSICEFEDITGTQTCNTAGLNVFIIGYTLYRRMALLALFEMEYRNYWADFTTKSREAKTQKTQG